MNRRLTHAGGTGWRLDVGSLLIYAIGLMAQFAETTTGPSCFGDVRRMGDQVDGADQSGWRLLIFRRRFSFQLRFAGAVRARIATLAARRAHSPPVCRLPDLSARILHKTIAGYLPGRRRYLGTWGSIQWAPAPRPTRYASSSGARPASANHFCHRRHLWNTSGGVRRINQPAEELRLCLVLSRVPVVPVADGVRQRFRLLTSGRIF